MKTKTKNKIKRTVAVSFICLCAASGLITMVSGYERDELKEKIDTVECEMVEAKGGLDNCVDIFKNSNYYKNNIITEQNNLAKKLENAQISSEDYSKKLSTLVSKEHAVEILQQSNEDALKNNYTNLQQIKKEKESEYVVLSDKKNNMEILSLAGFAGTIGFGVGSLLILPNRDQKEKD